MIEIDKATLDAWIERDDRIQRQERALEAAVIAILQPGFSVPREEIIRQVQAQFPGYGEPYMCNWLEKFEKYFMGPNRMMHRDMELDGRLIRHYQFIL